MSGTGKKPTKIFGVRTRENREFAGNFVTMEKHFPSGNGNANYKEGSSKSNLQLKVCLVHQFGNCKQKGKYEVMRNSRLTLMNLAIIKQVVSHYERIKKIKQSV